jgi:hypothetical protein
MSPLSRKKVYGGEWVDKLPSAAMKTRSGTLKESQELLEEFEEKISFVSFKILGKKKPSMREIGLLLEAVRLLLDIDHDTLLYRNAETVNDTNTPFIRRAIEQQKSLLALRERLNVTFDLQRVLSDQNLDEAIAALAGANIFSYFTFSYYEARNLYKSLSPPQGVILKCFPKISVKL